MYGIEVRSLRLRDALWCWRLAKDKGVRANSVDKSAPTPWRHCKWLWEWAVPWRTRFALAVVTKPEGLPAGHVRIGPARTGYANHYELHISLFPWARNAGYGTQVLVLARKAWGGRSILLAYVREENVRAQAAFTKAGWEHRGVTYWGGLSYAKFVAN